MTLKAKFFTFEQISLKLSGTHKGTASSANSAINTTRFAEGESITCSLTHFFSLLSYTIELQISTEHIVAMTTRENVQSKWMLIGASSRLSHNSHWKCNCGYNEIPFTNIEVSSTKLPQFFHFLLFPMRNSLYVSSSTFLTLLYGACKIWVRTTTGDWTTGNFSTYIFLKSFVEIMLLLKQNYVS